MLSGGWYKTVRAGRGSKVTRYVGLLYSIVLAPGRRVVMADLRALAKELGLARPRTLLATGNLVFEADGTDPRALEALVEPAFAERFGRQVDIIVREAAGWRRLLASNPFPEASAREPARVAVRVMRTPIGEEVLQALEPFRTEDERIAVAGGDLWIHFGHGQGGSRLAAAATPARTGGAGTFRNWNTVRRIGAMLEA
jgi:uncharacterized protein (DUF1697 family)